MGIRVVSKNCTAIGAHCFNRGATYILAGVHMKSRNAEFSNYGAVNMLLKVGQVFTCSVLTVGLRSVI